MYQVNLLLIFALVCGEVVCETSGATAKPPSELTSTNVEQPLSYIPHATFPYSETYPNPGYENYLVPLGPQYPDMPEEETTAVAAPTILQIALKMFAKVGLFLLGGVALLFVGGIFTTAVCSLTPLCTITFAGFQNVNKETMRSYVTADGISAAASFVQDAIGKYQRLQREDHTCIAVSKSEETIQPNKKMDLYITSMSIPCNTVLLVAKALKLNLKVKEVDLEHGDNKTPEFLKMNPQHTVPTLDDSGFYIWESRAILTYLVNKYGSRDDPLYPRDPKPRALVEQRLYFDAISLYPAFAKCYFPLLFGGKNEVNPDDLQNAKDVFELFDVFLESTEYVAVDTFTVADVALTATVTAFELCQFDLSPYKRVSLWFSKAKEVCPGYQDILIKNTEALKQLYEKNLAQSG
ncbi:putative glutathione S-transferase, C-terminal domain [Trypoxylus dichotomus]